jgi:2-C-methyl-D-erythritol 4-phosphate cytidylyltransferase
MTGTAVRCSAILPAAGVGSRMGGDLPKQYLTLAGTTLLEHSLRALLDCPRIDVVVVALNPHDVKAGSLPLLRDPRVIRVDGGDERCDSVLAGLDVLAGEAVDTDWVLVHDAARPCVRPADIERLIEAVIAAGTGGILAEPIVDTVKRAGADGLVNETLDRSCLWRAQTPQMFRLLALREALGNAREQGLGVTDEASAMELAGGKVQLVAGSPGNLKVTVPADLPLAEWYLQQYAAEYGE